jgi:hypothetical protein
MIFGIPPRVQKRADGVELQDVLKRQRDLKTHHLRQRQAQNGVPGRRAGRNWGGRNNGHNSLDSGSIPSEPANSACPARLPILPVNRIRADATLVPHNAIQTLTYNPHRQSQTIRLIQIRRFHSHRAFFYETGGSKRFHDGARPS